MNAVSSDPAGIVRAVRDRPTVFLHVGLPKTGTTYLQGVLHANRPALRRSGLLYPGTQHAHFWASQDLRGHRFQGSIDRHVPGAWGRLVKEVGQWPGRTLIDHESFGSAGQLAITRAMDDLAFGEVHVVLTVRDLARQLPAAWQEKLKNGGTETFGAFLSAVADPERRSRSARGFWANQDAVAILARWGRGLPPARVHVVTVPPSGADPSLLWQRFAGLLGLDPEEYPARPQRSANTSLGAAEAAVLRRFNAVLADQDVPWPVYATVFKHEVAPALAARRGTPIEVPEAMYDWAVHRSRQMADGLRSAGYHIVGDLDELIPRMRSPGFDPDAPPADAQADAAAAALVSLVPVITASDRARSAMRRTERGALARLVENLLARVPALARLRTVYRAHT